MTWRHADVAALMAIFSGFSRKGAWQPDPVMNIVTILGGTELDFRDAILPGKEIMLRATTVLGGLDIIVPPDMRVVDNGFAILGGRDITGNAGEAASPTHLSCASKASASSAAWISSERRASSRKGSSAARELTSASRAKRSQLSGSVRS